ncbi:MAG: 50S ribosomal protein L22 [Actinomycetota bacterium]|nr:50S ribosomal protein L22 [Actinomycetota bacterium]
MAGSVKTNERPGTRATVRYARVSASKARPLLDEIRGLSTSGAAEVLAFSERAVARLIARCLDSAVANAVTNDGIPANELYVSACFADEGPTLQRWRPRARGRATRIRKRTCHITVIVTRYEDDELALRRAREAARGTLLEQGEEPTDRRRRGRRVRAHDEEVAGDGAYQGTTVDSESGEDSNAEVVAEVDEDSNAEAAVGVEENFEIEPVLGADEPDEDESEREVD